MAFPVQAYERLRIQSLGWRSFDAPKAVAMAASKATAVIEEE